MWTRLKKLMEFVGYTELAVFTVVMAGILVYIDRDERRVERAATERQEIPLMPQPKQMPPFEQVDGSRHFRTVRTEQWDCLITDMSGWTDSTCTRGWMTFPKTVADLMELVGQDGPYYLWAEDNRYFPLGTLLRVYEIRQDSTRIQFLFTAERDLEGRVGDMATQLDGLLRQVGETRITTGESVPE